MSDRIAVFNEGAVEQIGPPTEIYERPDNAFVAGFVGVSNLLERDGRQFTVRPEKISMIENGKAPTGLHVEEGTIKDVSYAGHDHPLSRRPRSGGITPNRPPKPGDVLRGCPGPTRPQSENRMASGSDRRRRGRGGRKVSRFRARSAWLPAAIVGGLAATMLVIAGCGGGDEEEATTAPPRSPSGQARVS